MYVCIKTLSFVDSSQLSRNCSQTDSVSSQKHLNNSVIWTKDKAEFTEEGKGEIFDFFGFPFSAACKAYNSFILCLQQFFGELAAYIAGRLKGVEKETLAVRKPQDTVAKPCRRLESSKLGDVKRDMIGK